MSLKDRIKIPQRIRVLSGVGSPPPFPAACFFSLTKRIYFIFQSCRAAPLGARGRDKLLYERKAERKEPLFRATRMMCPISPSSLLKYFLERRIPA